MMEKRIEKTVEWIREIVGASKTDGILVGLSGGIDSAVVGFLIKKAFPENSLGVILPCKSSPKDAEDAKALAEASGLDYFTVDLTDVQGQLLKNTVDAMGTHKKENLMRLTDANLRARMRMSTLYAVANANNYLVAGTDNAAEVYTGYFTKYGDGGVDLLPIASLTKREVYEWARHLGVPQSILDRAPSAGLWEGQTDESEMGTTYAMIDDLIEGKEIPDKDRSIIENLHARTEHKRIMPPACPSFRE